MLRDIRGWITVHDVARAMGVELTNHQAWAVGKQMEKLWSWAVGTPPIKDNRVKKIGIGSHCFAHYPPTDEWRERVQRQIRTVIALQARQLDFFT